MRSLPALGAHLMVGWMARGIRIDEHAPPHSSRAFGFGVGEEERRMVREACAAIRVDWGAHPAAPTCIAELVRHGLSSLFLEALEEGAGWTYEQMGVLRERTWAVRGRRGVAFVTLRGADAARLERGCAVRGWTRGDVARVAVWYMWELYVGLDRVSRARFGGTG